MIIADTLNNFVANSTILRQMEEQSEFRVIEESLDKTLAFLAARYSVLCAYDYITNPVDKRNNDMLFKIRNDRKEVMWVYFKYSVKSKYISLEVDNDTVKSVKPLLYGFDSIKERHYQNYPTLKLIFHNYKLIENSLEKICVCLDQGAAPVLHDINTPLKPRNVLLSAEGSVRYICGRCGKSFKKASRCPECGQLIKSDIASSSSRTICVGDNVSGMKIYEIINKYFGENYSGWMKAGYAINSDYCAWFPTISKNNARPDGNYGGSAMWSNTLSPDKKTIISMNHDATIDDIPANERNNTIKRRSILVFGRINGVFEFLGVFDDKLVLENRTMTFRHDRMAKGINLSTFELIDPD